MCGIMGVLSDGRIDGSRVAVRSMIADSRHRGPDAQGNVEIPLPARTLILGHTRLSILDLSEASGQPIRHVETGSWLVYNGEIYNFRLLRSELETRGVRFRTSGDTEVLLEALIEWGERALEKIDGMFAFAFWDGRAKTLLLARDRMGIKPLYYHAARGTFAFASEVKVLERSQICPLTIDGDAVDSFLTYGAVIGPNSIWREIRELEPGHLLRVNAEGEITDSVYWELADAIRQSEAPARKFEQSVAEIKEWLGRAVHSHLVSDVPVGVFLSGGVDSSLLSLLASRCSESPITLLTVAFPEQEFSELPYARRMAENLPHPHEVVTLSAQELREMLPDALRAMDQPTVDGMNTYVICKAGAAYGLKVLLTGIGGDELFGGYSTFIKVPKLLNYSARYGSGLRPVARLLSKLRTRNPIQWRKVADSRAIRSLADAYLLQRSIRWRSGRSSELAARLEECVKPLESDYQKVAALELQFYLRNQLLRDGDVFSMAHSVELRVPFLDGQLLKAALAMPAQQHFTEAQGKRLTRRVLEDLAGRPIPPRQKMGFTFPWQQWLRKVLKETIARTLRDRQLYEPLALDPAYGRELLQGLERNDPLQPWSEVWSLFVLLNWQARTGVECAVA